MSSHFTSNRAQSRLTPSNHQQKTIEKTGVSKAIFGTLKTQQHQHQTPQPYQSSTNNQLSQSKRFEYSAANQELSHQRMGLKQSQYVREQNKSRNSRIHNEAKISSSQSQHHSQPKLQQKIQFLQHCMNEYKQQALAMYSKLQERQKYYLQVKQRYQSEIVDLKQQVSSLQKQIHGQSLLIQQCHQKYDSQLKQRHLCLNLISQQKSIIFRLNTEILSLQHTVANTREVSANLIKQNQNLKAQLMIEKEKYELLFGDYGQLKVRHEREVKEMCEENVLLIRKLDELEMELKIYEKDKEIEKLLDYQQSINKRQKELMIMDQASSSPPSVIYHHNASTSPYEYVPRRLNFQDQNNSNSRSGKKRFLDKRHEHKQGYSEIIQLQKSKISHLENQLKQMEKRNKELQTLMVKFMK